MIAWKCSGATSGKRSTPAISCSTATASALLVALATLSSAARKSLSEGPEAGDDDAVAGGEEAVGDWVSTDVVADGVEFVACETAFGDADFDVGVEA